MGVCSFNNFFQLSLIHSMAFSRNIRHMHIHGKYFYMWIYMGIGDYIYIHEVGGMVPHFVISILFVAFQSILYIDILYPLILSYSHNHDDSIFYRFLYIFNSRYRKLMYCSCLTYIYIEHFSGAHNLSTFSDPPDIQRLYYSWSSGRESRAQQCNLISGPMHLYIPPRNWAFFGQPSFIDKQYFMHQRLQSFSGDPNNSVPPFSKFPAIQKQIFSFLFLFISSCMV